MHQAKPHTAWIRLALLLSTAAAACRGSADDESETSDVTVTEGAGSAGSTTPSGGTGTTIGAKTTTVSPSGRGGANTTGGAALAAGSGGTAAGVDATGGMRATGAANVTGGTGAANVTGGTGAANVTGGTGAANVTGGTGAANVTGGTGAANVTGGAGAANVTGGAGAANVTGGTGAANVTGGTGATGGAGAAGGSTDEWPNIRVVDNHLCDRWGKPFAVRSIESMYGNGTSNAAAFVAGHKALGANAMGPLPNSSVSSANDINELLAAAYANGLVVGLNADHTNQGERFFQNAQIRTLVNRYPNVFLQEAVELGSNMSENQWVQAAKAKVDAYVDLYPDKPLKIGSPFGGRSPRFPLDRCGDIVKYYYSRGGRGGLIFTCQLYWRATNADWSYQEENGFRDGLAGILEAVDAMAASPCLFMPGLDNEDDVGYTGWREVMDHVREGNADPGLRLSFQWWVYYNSGDEYGNDLTTNANDALRGITSTGLDVKEKLELDRQYIELGPLNP